MNRLQALAAAGTAPWLDFVERRFVEDGKLQALVDEDGVTGVTSNPSIFEKAIGGGTAYDDALAAFDRSNPDAATVDRYEHLAVADIVRVADILRPVYDRTDARDGYVSLEVSPTLADDTDGTIAEARKLWTAVDRPNLMVKIPGTRAGAPAITAAIADGINVNVTLLFSREDYARVLEAHAAGLEERVRTGRPLDRVASVASFFVSRIDARIDGEIDRRVAAGDADADTLSSLRGKVAVANAKLAYADYQAFIASDRWQALAAKGAQPQRLLWASTGVKDPAYPDTLYVDQLIGPDTVNTMPPATLAAFRERGTVAPTLTADVDDARDVMAQADRLGLDLPSVTGALAVEGVAAFVASFDTLLAAVAGKKPAA
jgi:transaldolase